MTHAEATALIGRKGAIVLERMVVHVRIVDVRSSYGHEQYLCHPVAGGGQPQWKDAERVSLLTVAPSCTESL